MGPFDRFNDRAKRVVALAQDEAIRFNHNYIGTEHLLLGLVREGEGTAGRVLDDLGVSLSKLRTSVEQIIGRGDSTTSPSEIVLSPSTKKVFELAIDESRKLGHSHVGTEHLLLGLGREGGHVGAQVLESLGLTLEKVRHETIAAIGRKASDASARASAFRSPDQGGPFGRFNDRAKKVLAFAQEDAVRLKHNYIGTEHLLLGLVREGESVAARVLESLGVELSKVRTAVESIIGHSDAPVAPNEITISPRTRKVIDLATEEARLLGHQHVGAEHLLLGLVREGQGIASGVLESLGVTLEKVREQVLATLGQSTPGADRPTRSGSPSALDRLDDAAKRVLALAKNEAVGLGHTWLGTDHLLLGLISANGTVAQTALKELGVALDPAREHVAKAEQPSAECRTPAIALTQGANRLVSAAADLAGAGPIRPEYLLLAYAADPEARGSQILSAFGATAEKVREAVDRSAPPR